MWPKPSGLDRLRTAQRKTWKHETWSRQRHIQWKALMQPLFFPLCLLHKSQACFYVENSLVFHNFILRSGCSTLSWSFSRRTWSKADTSAGKLQSQQAKVFGAERTSYPIFRRSRELQDHSYAILNIYKAQLKKLGFKQREQML